MARFQYRMQNILEIKNKMEEQTKLQYAQARIRLTEEEETLTSFYKRKEGYLEQGRTLRNQGLNVRDLKNNREALLRMDDYIKQQIIQVTIAEKNLESVRQKLQNVMVERKTHEKLREKAFEAFVQEENAKESKEIDELTSYLYGQRINEDR